MKMFQKLIATILIIAMVSSLGLNIFLYKPKKAQAMDLGGSWATFTQTLLQVIKDLGLDTIARGVARSMMLKLQRDLIRWAQGGFSDENKPFAMMSFKEELLDSLNIATARWLQEYNLTALCQPFRPVLNLNLGLGDYLHTAPSYREYAACTIEDVIDNVEEFWRNPSLAITLDGGSSTDRNTTWNERWGPWLHTSMYKGNIYGQAVLGFGQRGAQANLAKQDKEMEVVTNQGYLNEGVCTDGEGEECKKWCRDKYLGEGPPSPQQQTDLNGCLKNCEIQGSMGICVNRTITKLGSTIHSGVEKVTQSDIDWLITTDEITELIGVFFSALLNKAIHGISGLVAKPRYTYRQADYRETYSYYQKSRQTLTRRLGEDLRSEVLSAINKNLGQMNRRTVQCGGDPKKKQMRIEQLAESLPEILEGEVQHLYTGMLMVNLKPDYKVLDPPGAPFTVYGTTWDEIPFKYYPPRCAELTKEFGNNFTCKQIPINLPYGLDITNINSICTASCLAAVYEYAEGCGTSRNACLDECRWVEAGNRKRCQRDCFSAYNACINNAISQAVRDGKCSGEEPEWPEGGGDGGGCFLTGTKILMPDGSFKNVEDIKINDRILSFDNGNNLIAKPVSKLFPSLVDDYYVLKTENREVNVTGRHRFYIGNEFKPVKELSIGDKIYVLEKGKLILEKIISKELIKKQVKVYNFKVEGTQTYFANGFGVHNTKDVDIDYEYKLEAPMIPFEEIFKTGTKTSSRPIILAQRAEPNGEPEEGYCGDGVIDIGEECDDNNNVSGDGCSADCVIEEAGVCGDGVINSGEQCDDGNNVNGDGCSGDCLSDETCGNGIIDTATGEECDDNNTVSGDGCSADCVIEEGGICGDGVVHPDEQCDDGNTANGDGCSGNCMFEEPPPEEPVTGFSEIKECMDGVQLIALTENRCRECLEAAQKNCEAETDPDLEDACIQEVCNNYEGIEGGGMSPIADGLDFYQRCSTVEKKHACEVCLKEYFVPASYCQQVLDYMSRAFIKYPAVVYIEDREQSWVVKIIKWIIPIWGIFEWIFGGGAPDPGNWWIGWYDSDSGCKNNKDAPKNKISVGLICRAFEEFKYKGSNICETACRTVTPEERRDVLDFEPTDADCGNAKIGEALPPQEIINAGVFKARTKCCAALAGNETTYRACRFGEVITGTGTGWGSGCFLAGTRILMAGGTYKPIKDVRKGDWILTKESESSDKMVAAKVAKTFEHTTNSYLVINNKLKVTDIHPVFVNGKWKQAGAIKLGNKLLNEKDQEVVVESLEIKKETVKVYNLEIEGYETYFAGGFYVHNKEALPPELGQ